MEYIEKHWNEMIFSASTTFSHTCSGDRAVAGNARSPARSGWRDFNTRWAR